MGANRKEYIRVPDPHPVNKTRNENRFFVRVLRSIGPLIPPSTLRYNFSENYDDDSIDSTVKAQDDPT